MKLAFLGMGAMGSRMAARLIAAGHDVSVWNRDIGKTAALAVQGAVPAASPRAAAAGADAVLAMVRDDEASRAVWLPSSDGAFAGMPPGALAIECSTLTVSWAREWAASATQMGLAAIDAPVVGSRPQAEAGQLAFLLGGTMPACERATPLLRAMASAVHHCGEQGCGAALKLAVNALFGVQVATLAELLGLLAYQGVSLPRAIDIMGTLPVTSPVAKTAAGAMLAGQAPPLFPVALAEKDLGYVLAAVPQGSGHAPLSGAAREVMQRAMARGWGDDNLTGVTRLYR